eukprot:664902-Prorocentrum_minimum.AAC.1
MGVRERQGLRLLRQVVFANDKVCDYSGKFCSRTTRFAITPASCVRKRQGLRLLRQVVFANDK